MNNVEHRITRDIPQEASYEELVQRLEASLERLESGELSLEDSVHEYEYGMELIQRCNEMLDKAELRITEVATRAGAGADLDDEDFHEQSRSRQSL